MKKLGLLGLAHMLIATSVDKSTFMIDGNVYKPESKQKAVKFKYTGYTPKKQGQQKFTYPDGFECHALNKKNADKKHNRWKKGQVK